MFDINSPDAFFRAIVRNAKQLRDEPAKETDRLLFVIFGLNHLREWIAPGYDFRKPPSNKGERFYQSIFSDPSFKQINQICNHTKHLSPIGVQRTSYGLNIDDWPDFDAVESVDDGPPSGYEVDGKDVLETVFEVIEFYQRNWFDQLENEP